MKKSLWTAWVILTHAVIILATMFLVFFVIDRFNPVMEFISSEISKWLLCVFAVCALADGILSVACQLNVRYPKTKRVNPPHREPVQRKKITHQPEKFEEDDLFFEDFKEPKRSLTNRINDTFQPANRTTVDKDAKAFRQDFNDSLFDDSDTQSHGYRSDFLDPKN